MNIHNRLACLGRTQISKLYPFLTTSRREVTIFGRYRDVPDTPSMYKLESSLIYRTFHSKSSFRNPAGPPRAPALRGSQEVSVVELNEWAYERVANTSVKYTIIDVNGDACKPESKSRRKFLAEFHLHPRDLRFMDNPRSVITPSIMVRQDAILVNMLELRVIIQHNRLIILDYSDDAVVSSRLGAFLYDLRDRLRNRHGDVEDFTQPYEMRVLESIFMMTVAALDHELGSDLEKLKAILIDLEDHVDRDLLKELLVRSKALSAFYQKTSLVSKLIDDTLDNDEDLVAMYLTEKFEGKVRDLNDHSEIELLFESYYTQVNETLKQAEQVLSNIKSTEEIINIMLDSNRNSLMLYELKVTIGTLGMTLGMFFASLYGMNLKNYIEESDYGFGAVTVSVFLIAGVVSVMNLRHLKRLKRISVHEGSYGLSSSRSRHRGFLAARRAKSRIRSPQERRMMWKWLIEERSP